MHAKSETINASFFLRAFLLGVLVILFVAARTHAQQTGDNQLSPQDQAIVDASDSALQGAGGPANQELSQNGIFGCLGQGARVANAGQNAAIPSNVGTTRAIGGVYVPVNDAAVTLNTGFLVYKECILDGMARKIAESGTSEMGRQALRSFNEGRSGNAQYLQNFGSYFRPYFTQITVNNVQAIQSGGMCGAYRGRVATAMARTFARQLGTTPVSVSCAFASDAERAALVGGSAPVGWGSGWMNLISGGYELAEYNREILANEAELARFEEDQRQMIMMGRGVIPIFDGGTNPLAMNVITPGFVIADAIAQITGSGYRQLEMANEVDQIVSNLWGGLTTRLLSSGSGVPGLFVSTGNQPAYIDRMVAQTQAAVRAGAVNAAVNILANARSVEAAYLTAKQGTATALINAISQLRSMESTCWGLIIPKVQTHAQSNGNPALNIATSTQFSQQIIDAQIRTVASTTAAEVIASQQALAQIEQLIASVTNSASTAAQQQALLQLDQMVAQNRLHSQQDAQNAASQRDSVTNTLTTLVNDTRTTWGDSQDPNIGWCNVNNTAVVERWFNAWRQ